MWSAGAEEFGEQLRCARSHLDLIGPDDLDHAIRRGKGRYGLITFDDGYRDNYEVAFPILKAERVPATFFVVTGFVDRPRLPWWDDIAWMLRASTRRGLNLHGWIPTPIVFDEPDREHAIRQVLRVYKSLPADRTDEFLDAVGAASGSGRCLVAGDCWMTWDMLREMRAEGMTIGGHTVTHPVLARTTRERQEEEILGCGRRLASEIGAPMRYFSYPVGGRRAFNAATRECLRKAGVRYAFSNYGGLQKLDRWDDYDVRRVSIERDPGEPPFQSLVSVPQFAA